ncbi:MAG TPA: M28 family peptidase [Thermoanaerobaculia bacterium]|nr:M28 family peptidase [Thermoanaerobaculia bacterium]
MKRAFALTIAVLAALAIAAAKKTSDVPPAVERAKTLFRADAIAAHDKFLASDLLEGRGPGTRGDALAEEYIATELQSYGLKPGGDNGTYFQKVPLIGVTYDPAKSSIAFTRDGATVAGPLKYLDEFVAADASQTPSSTLDSDVIFVGHGVVAPEYRWDDYKGVDVRGKTLVMLVDDPPASASEPDLFKGRARTYYGRWTYKYEIGAAKGALGVILIHTDEAAGYGWQVVRNSWGREQDFIGLKPGQPALHLESWITGKVANDLFRAAGQDLAALTKAAASRDFRPLPLGVRLTGTITSTLRPFDTRNVVARLEGSDPKLRSEAVLYSAHHDHLGIGTPDSTGDRIYNGAVDNASGTALLLEMARVWANTRPAPKRTVLFNSVAAEEQGLLGSEWFGENPTMAAGKIALAINYDGLFEFGKVGSVTMLGVERMSFDPTAERVAKAMNLKIVPDQDPEQGHYYRSDHFSFAKAGIPAFSISQGHDILGKPADYGRKLADEYRAKHYHQPSDEFDPNWDWSSAVQLGQFGFWLGWDAANAAQMPNWKPGDEFRAARDRSLAH